MRKFIGTIFLVGILYFSWPTIEQLILKSDFSKPYLTLKEKIETIYTTLDNHSVLDYMNEAKDKFIPTTDINNDTDSSKVVLLENDFSINHISLKDPRSLVELANGTPKNAFINEFGSTWYVYHRNYENFIMVSYDSNDLVNAIYTNQPNINSKYTITEQSSMEQIRQTLQNRKTAIIKENTYLAIDEQFDLFELETYDVTFFYDHKKDNVISAILLIDKNLEEQKKTFYAAPSEELQQAYEQQMFEVINATRAKFNLSTLTYNAPLALTAFKHSEDMATNNFFSHQNLKGESPFDRMEKDQLNFTFAGENLASGQFNSIYAHEALMNSQGHRDNILNKDFEQIGIGVDFNNGNVPYYTIKFYTP